MRVKVMSRSTDDFTRERSQDLQTRCNSICWNPREPMNFTAYGFSSKMVIIAGRYIYHTKRMQRVFCVKYTYDGTYLVSGSDDTNLRLWRSKDSEQLGVVVV